MKKLLFVLILLTLLGLSFSSTVPVGIILTNGRIQNQSGVTGVDLPGIGYVNKIQNEMELNITDFSVVDENETVFYDLVVFREKKLFGLIPLRVDSRMRINSEDGQIVRHQKPWWSFLAI